MCSWVCTFYGNIWFLSLFVFVRLSCLTKPVHRSFPFNASILPCSQNYYVPLLWHSKSPLHNRIFLTNFRPVPQWHSDFPGILTQVTDSRFLLTVLPFFFFFVFNVSGHMKNNSSGSLDCGFPPFLCTCAFKQTQSAIFQFVSETGVVTRTWLLVSYHCHVVLYFSCVSRALATLQ